MAPFDRIRLVDGRLAASATTREAQPKTGRTAVRPGRYVLVAIPCRLKGIYTYIHRLEPELADRIHATIGLLCGWQYSHHSLCAISQYKGVDFHTLTDVAWRGGRPVANYG